MSFWHKHGGRFFEGLIKAHEWASSMFISRTTVGWTVRWLTGYEFWEMTGRWIGGGRHEEIGTEKGDSHAA